jgi:hypothetical protein
MPPLRDIDPRMREYVAIGQGVMDLKAITDEVKCREPKRQKRGWRK